MKELTSLYLSVLLSTLPIALVCFGVERLRPAERGQSVAATARNAAYFCLILAFSLGLGQAAGPLYAWLLPRAGVELLPRLLPEPRTPAGLVVATLVYAFIWDLWQYGVHRWQHASALLWRTHRLHHDENALNASAQGRHHPAHHILNAILYLPIFLLLGGMSPPAAAAFVMFRIYGFLNHANLRLSLGRATPFIAGPQWHRIHHSCLREHADRNFATFFPVIDLIFGTYYGPAADEYPPTGLTREEPAG
jgi:sterol desaturase/sphingolipid hydroxylase (fatty acid hydroxylase superfamily)